MGRPICQAYVERNLEIAREYTEKGKSLEELAEQFGLSKVRLRDILLNQNVQLRPEPRRAHFERRSKSNVLIAMGARLHADRMSKGLSLAEYALKLGLSEARLSEALRGLYNWRFNEIERAAKVIGVAVEDFIKPPTGVARSLNG